MQPIPSCNAELKIHDPTHICQGLGKVLRGQDPLVPEACSPELLLVRRPHPCFAEPTVAG